VGAPDSQHIEGYADSVHGAAARRGDPDAPGCADCHGSHDIRSPKDPSSRVYQTNIPDTCGKCHFDAALTKRHHLLDVSAYENSVHAKMVGKNRLLYAAVCTDCHGTHDIQSPEGLMSPTNKRHVAATCGRCHDNIYKQYEQSIHGKAVARGVKDAPTCIDCHGEHGIQRKYGLPANRLSTYMNSYHGIANKFGDITVANCATCHGSHNVLPSSDPRSTVNKKNLPRTCGKCHPGAGVNFANGSIHVFPTMHRDVFVYWVRLAYRCFIFLLVGSFCGYILLDLIARWRGRLPGS
jgi:hypothetical protein